MNSEQHILIVDDNPKNLQLLASILTEEGYQLGVTLNGQDAIEYTINNTPDLILLDVMMPGIDGFEVCEILKNTPSVADIPVIFITAKDETQDKVRGFEQGAVDFVTKPISPPEILARVKTHLSLKNIKENLEDLVRVRTKELEQVNSELVKANKAKSDFLLNISHELKTPLNHIVGMTELMLFDEVSDEQMEYIQTMKNASAQLLSIFNNLLTLSSVERGDLLLPESNPFSMESVYHSLESHFNASQKREGKHNTLSVTIDQSIPDHIIGDKARYELILFNLLDNAVKFSEGEGLIDIRTELLEEFPEYLSLRTKVSDNGVGLTTDAIETIFDQFSKAEMGMTQKFGGAGIGLSLVKSFIESMGGTIVVDSPGLGLGSTFTIEYSLNKCL